MLKLWVNGEERELAAPCALDQALKSLGHERGRFAVAIDGDFVPRHAYASFAINGGEHLEILTPMQGG